MIDNKMKLSTGRDRTVKKYHKQFLRRDGTGRRMDNFWTGRNGETQRGIFSPRGGSVKYFPLAGREGDCLFPRRDGMTNTYFHGGAGQYTFPPSAGRDGKHVFPRRKRTAANTCFPISAARSALDVIFSERRLEPRNVFPHRQRLPIPSHPRRLRCQLVALLIVTLALYSWWL